MPDAIPSRAANDERICPTCLRPYHPIHPPRRICADCGQPIARHDKFTFGEDSRVRHRYCDNPESYRARVEDAA